MTSIRTLTTTQIEIADKVYFGWNELQGDKLDTSGHDKVYDILCGWLRANDKRIAHLYGLLEFGHASHECEELTRMATPSFAPSKLVVVKREWTPREKFVHIINNWTDKPKSIVKYSAQGIIDMLGNGLMERLESLVDNPAWCVLETSKLVGNRLKNLKDAKEKSERNNQWVMNGSVYYGPGSPYSPFPPGALIAAAQGVEPNYRNKLIKEAQRGHNNL